jgi:hypothetical protein
LAWLKVLSAFFSFIKNSHDPGIHNPRDNPALRKLFRAGKPRFESHKEPAFAIAYRSANALLTLFFTGLILTVAGFRLYGNYEVER